MITLALRYWYFIVIVGLLAFCGVQQVRISNANAYLARIEKQYAEERQKAAEASRQAEQDAREEEQRREQRKQEILDEAEGRTELARAAAADAERAADGLRKRLAAFVAQARGGSENPKPAGQGQGKQGADALDVLAGVLTRSSDRAGELATYADQLRIAGLACEAHYDSLRP